MVINRKANLLKIKGAYKEVVHSLAKDQFL